MDVKQIIIIIINIFMVPVLTHKMPVCYEEQDLEAAAEKKLRSHYPQPPEPSPGRLTPASCPVELYQQQPPPAELSGRSLSPWRYVTVTKEDHFPSTYAEAQCLCAGCIIIQDSTDQDARALPQESSDYNSVPIKQSRVFLKKELCEDKTKYHLKPVSVDVAVGCTCARARST